MPSASPTSPSIGRGNLRALASQIYALWPMVFPRAKRSPSTTKKFLAAGGLALGVGSLGLFASAGTAAADGLDATPLPPAVIDEDGFHNYDASSYPADPSWPAPPSWGSWPADPSWSGTASHPCCSR
jgi:hypothetical protein